jgi:hypothetical protein
MTNHPNRKRTYPDQTLENAARAAGIDIAVFWEMRGPPNTFVDWMVAYSIGHTPVIVQTYKNGNGWNAFTPCQSIAVDETIADVFKRCGVEPSPEKR